jgi:hypothetical protein
MVSHPGLSRSGAEGAAARRTTLVFRTTHRARTCSALVQTPDAYIAQHFFDQKKLPKKTAPNPIMSHFVRIFTIHPSEGTARPLQRCHIGWRRLNPNRVVHLIS